MKVGELMELLARMDPEDRVGVACLESTGADSEPTAVAVNSVSFDAVGHGRQRVLIETEEELFR